MNNRFINNILREIESLAPKRGKHEFIEEKGSHAYEAVRKLFDLIEAEYDEETSTDLLKRFVNAVKTSDYKKFKRGIERAKKDREAEVDAK